MTAKPPPPVLETATWHGPLPEVPELKTASAGSCPLPLYRTRLQSCVGCHYKAFLEATCGNNPLQGMQSTPLRTSCMLSKKGAGGAPWCVPVAKMAAAFTSPYCDAAS